MTSATSRPFIPTSTTTKSISRPNQVELKPAYHITSHQRQQHKNIIQEEKIKGEGPQSAACSLQPVPYLSA